MLNMKGNTYDIKSHKISEQSQMFSLCFWEWPLGDERITVPFKMMEPT